jgi:hypothetical protein
MKEYLDKSISTFKLAYKKKLFVPSILRTTMDNTVANPITTTIYTQEPSRLN